MSLYARDSSREAISEMVDDNPDWPTPDELPPTLQEVDPEEYLKQLEVEAANLPEFGPDDVIEDTVWEEPTEVGKAFHYRPPPSKPMFAFRRFQSGEPMDYEYIVEGLLRFGHNAWSGPRGSGKTSTLIPMLLAIAGLLPDYPLPIKLRRQVLLVTEDEEQVWMVIRGMIADGYLKASIEELNDWFHVALASRLSTDDIIDHGSELEKMSVPNERANGTMFPAGPLLVMDTVSACIDTENSSSNDEVAADVEEIKSKLRHTAVLLIGHTAKDGSGKTQTFLGAQAWEANTIGSVTLKVNDNKTRELVVTKNRFSAESPRFKVEPNFVRFPGKDVLGNDTMITSLYNLIEPMTQEDIEASQEADAKASKERRDRELRDELMSKIVEVLGRRNPDGLLMYPEGVPKGKVYDELSGKPDKWRPFTDALEDAGKIAVIKDGTTGRITLKDGGDAL